MLKTATSRAIFVGVIALLLFLFGLPAFVISLPENADVSYLEVFFPTLFAAGVAAFIVSLVFVTVNWVCKGE